MARGGARPRAGRPKGQGKFGVETKPVRIPRALVAEVIQYAAHNAYKLPLYSCSVPAGSPFMADDHVEAYVPIHEHIIPHPRTSFLLRVSGDSMIKAGIFDGDLLVVDRYLEPQHGKIVVASVDDEVTVKRLYQKEGITKLLPENDGYPSIEVPKGGDFRVCGVVIHVLHKV